MGLLFNKKCLTVPPSILSGFYRRLEEINYLTSSVGVHSTVVMYMKRRLTNDGVDWRVNMTLTLTYDGTVFCLVHTLCLVRDV
jgi:hypothetical protein